MSSKKKCNRCSIQKELYTFINDSGKEVLSCTPCRARMKAELVKKKNLNKRKCDRCRVFKELGTFINDKGRDVKSCAPCRIYKKARYQLNKANIIKTQTIYNRERKDDIAKYQKKYWENNKVRLTTYGKEYSREYRKKSTN